MRKIIKPGNFTNGKKVVQIPDIEFELPPMEEPDDGEFSEITSFPDGTEAVENGHVIAGMQTGDAADTAADAEGADGQAPKAAPKAPKKPQAPPEPVVTEELKAEITAKLKKELVGELSRKKIRAQRECDKLLLDAKNEAEATLAAANQKKEQMLYDAEMQAAQIKKDAFDEGLKKGFEEKKQLLDNLAIYISNSIEEIKKERNSFFKEYEKELKNLAVDICEKLICQKVESDDMVMYGVIKDAVRYVRDTKWVKAEVSKELSGYLDSLEKELKQAGQNVEFIFAEGVPKDTCILNTSNGMVVATLSQQIKNMREFLNSLDKVEQDEDRS